MSRRKKENKRTKRTNEPGVNSSARREFCNTAFPVCICRLTLAWLLAKILQRYSECQPILIGLLSLVLDSLMPTRLSAVPCRLVTRVTLRQLIPRAPLSNSLTAFPYPLPVTQDLESKTLCLVSRKNIMLHCFYIYIKYMICKLIL